jgi:hypothetical protein
MRGEGNTLRHQESENMRTVKNITVAATPSFRARCLRFNMSDIRPVYTPMHPPPPPIPKGGINPP